jgi:uncharacterized protein (DUF427 family)
MPCFGSRWKESAPNNVDLGGGERNEADVSEQRGRVRIEQTAKWVRVMLGGETIADSRDVKMVWEKPYYPTYYFPSPDVRMDLLVATGDTDHSPSRGSCQICTVKTDRVEAVAAAKVWNDTEIDAIEGHVSFHWAAMDHWFEEQEEVYVHARDPYSRIDILQSTRHIEVVVNGVKVADTTQPRLLFETGLPTRYYIPKPDVAMELLTPTATETSCPYKGTASYWSVAAGEDTFDDIVWGYATPLRESIEIAGYLAFYNEKVDIIVDGVLQERPRTVFS